MCRGMGHDVRDIRGTDDEGMPDDDLWQIVQREKRLLITTDRGFSYRRYEPHYGLLLVRMRHPNRQKIHERVMRAMTRISEGQWPGLLVVMRETSQSFWRAIDR